MQFEPFAFFFLLLLKGHKADAFHFCRTTFVSQILLPKANCLYCCDLITSLLCVPSEYRWHKNSDAVLDQTPLRA